MVCCLLSEWCVATSFYQSSANHVSFYPLFNLRNLLYLIRVTPTEAKKIREKVHRSGLSQQEYLLRAALEQPILVIHELKPILTELRAWGRNLNQLTVLAHTGHVQTVYLNELTEALGKTYEALNGLLTEKGPVISFGDL